MSYSTELEMLTYKLRCRKCDTIFTTLLPRKAIFRGLVKCRCGCSTHDVLDGYYNVTSAPNEPPHAEVDLRPDFLAKTMNIPVYTQGRDNDMFDSWIYAMQKENERLMQKKQIETYFFNTEENNMKRTTNNNEATTNFEIVRKYTTERGIFTVEQLDPTDMFALIDDEEQTVYMAVKEEEPKYKTKKAVVNMHTGDLVYLDVTTKIHVYRPGTSELRVGDFLYSSKDYK